MKRLVEKKNLERVWNNWVIKSFMPQQPKARSQMKKLKSSVSFIAKNNSKFEELCGFLR